MLTGIIPIQTILVSLARQAARSALQQQTAPPVSVSPLLTMMAPAPVPRRPTSLFLLLELGIVQLVEITA